MRKKYIRPALFVQEIALQQMVCTSLNNLEGDTEVEKGEPETPGSTPVAGDGRRYDVWYDEELEDY
jgi:hypothetical protein